MSMLSNREITELCFVADAIAAVPDRAVEIVEFSIDHGVTDDNKRVLEHLMQQLCHEKDLEALAVKLLKSKLHGVRTMGEALMWAIQGRTVLGE